MTKEEIMEPLEHVKNGKRSEPSHGKRSEPSHAYAEMIHGLEDFGIG